MADKPRYACPFLVIAPFSTLTLRAILWCVCFHLSISHVRAGGGCVSTEHHGLIFQDMGFTVFEFSFWDSEQLCMDPNVLFSLVKVERPPSETFPRPDQQFYFPFLPTRLIIQGISRLGFV